jgi:hypothetical protein
VGRQLRRWVVDRGRVITFASDAHTTDALASNFYEAMAMAEHFGFRQRRRLPNKIISSLNLEDAEISAR